MKEIAAVIAASAIGLMGLLFAIASEISDLRKCIEARFGELRWDHKKEV